MENKEKRLKPFLMIIQNGNIMFPHEAKSYEEIIRRFINNPMRKPITRRNTRFLTGFDKERKRRNALEIKSVRKALRRVMNDLPLKEYQECTELLNPGTNLDIWDFFG